MRTLADGRPALRPPPSLEELRARRDEILEVCARGGASNVRVFGSVARGEQDEDSDLDLLVDFAPGVSLFDWAGLIGDLESLLGCAVDVAELPSLKARNRPRVVAEAVPL
jgi:predicted nucleotidyltransferase